MSKDSIAAFLKRTAAARASSGSDADARTSDADPEDWDDVDRTAARRDRRTHGEASIARGRRGLAPAFEQDGGVYASEKTSRAAVGMAPQRDADAASGDSVSDYETYDAPAPKRKDASESEDDTLQLVQQRRAADERRGAAVRDQLAAWQAAVRLRMALRPLHAAVHGLDGGRASARACADLRTLAVRLMRLYMEVTDAPAAPVLRAADIGAHAEETRWRPALAAWHRRAAPAATTLINRDPATQVDAALAAERDRLYARAAQRRLVSRGSSPVFDDDDFYRVLVRDAAASVGAAQPAPVLRERRGAPSTRPTQRPTTKGRTLRFDVHERLAGFMAPAGDAGCWSAERTAAFVSSIFPARA